MRVPYREDIASHPGPEPHGGCGNTMADAWIGGSVGGTLSSEITFFRCRPCRLVGKAISTSAESVEGGKDVTERNFGIGGRDPYAVTGSCVVPTWPGADLGTGE